MYSSVRGWSHLEDGGLVGVTENKDQNLADAGISRQTGCQGEDGVLP